VGTKLLTKRRKIGESVPVHGGSPRWTEVLPNLPTTPATAAPATISASAGTLRPGTRLVDVQFAAAYLAAVQRGDSLFSVFGASHLHEAKAPGAASVPICHDADPVHLPIRLKKLTQFFFRRIEVEIPNKNILQANASD